MARRAVYLVKWGGPSKRRHFGILIPRANYNRKTLCADYKTTPTVGTIIHVVGEPIMTGFSQEFRRNFDVKGSLTLEKIVFLGDVEESDTYDPSDEIYLMENTPRSVLEKLAMRVTPPSKGQNIREPVDGVKNKRCQEWTMEFLALLAKEGKISKDAIDIAQKERDPPDHGIFGMQPKA